MPSIAIISSSSDPASINIRNNLTKLLQFSENGDWSAGPILSTRIGENDVRLYLQEKHTLYSKGVDDLGADIILFLSTHSSKAAIPTLSVHPPGNWGSADLEGEPRQLCTAAASFMKSYFRTLEKYVPPTFEVVQEVTHHGPFLKTPCAFVEIGSTPKEWPDPIAGEAVAKALIETLSHPIKNYPSAIGIGGLHTCPNFTKIIQGEEFSIGHACAKYQLPNLDEEMLRQAIERTNPKSSHIFVAWKGLGAEKDRVAKIVEDSGLPWTKLR